MIQKIKESAEKTGNIKKAEKFLKKNPDYLTNSTSDKIVRRRKIANKEGLCTICPPHGGDNARKSKNKARKPRYKDKR